MTLPKKTLVDLPEDIGGDLLEDIRAGIIQGADDLFQDFVINRKPRASDHPGCWIALFFGEVEQAGVIAGIRLAE